MKLKLKLPTAYPARTVKPAPPGRSCFNAGWILREAHEYVQSADRAVRQGESATSINAALTLGKREFENAVAAAPGVVGTIAVKNARLWFERSLRTVRVDDYNAGDAADAAHTLNRAFSDVIDVMQRHCAGKL